MEENKFIDYMAILIAENCFVVDVPKAPEPLQTAMANMEAIVRGRIATFKTRADEAQRKFKEYISRGSKQLADSEEINIISFSSQLGAWESILHIIKEQKKKAYSELSMMAKDELDGNKFILRPSDRDKLVKRFEAFAEENKIANCPLGFVAYLSMNGLIDAKKVYTFLEVKPCTE